MAAHASRRLALTAAIDALHLATACDVIDGGTLLVQADGALEDEHREIIAIAVRDALELRPRVAATASEWSVNADVDVCFDFARKQIDREQASGQDVFLSLKHQLSAQPSVHEYRAALKSRQWPVSAQLTTVGRRSATEGLGATPAPTATSGSKATSTAAEAGRHDHTAGHSTANTDHVGRGAGNARKARGALKDASEHQSRRDVERDVFSINGAVYQGATAGYGAVLKAVQDAVRSAQALLGASSGPRTGDRLGSGIAGAAGVNADDGHRVGGEQEIVADAAADDACKRIATLLLRLGNRTVSGGDAYEAATRLLIPSFSPSAPQQGGGTQGSKSTAAPGVHAVEGTGVRAELPLLLVADSQAAPPIELTIDVGPYQTSHGASPSSSSMTGAAAAAAPSLAALQSLVSWLDLSAIPIDGGADRNGRSPAAAGHRQATSLLLLPALQAAVADGRRWRVGARCSITATTVYRLMVEQDHRHQKHQGRRPDANLNVADDASTREEADEDDEDDDDAAAGLHCIARVTATYVQRVGWNPLGNQNRYHEKQARRNGEAGDDDGAGDAAAGTSGGCHSADVSATGTDDDGDDGVEVAGDGGRIDITVEPR